MKSIRLTLVVSLLLLLVFALGVTSALVYGITFTAVQAKNRTTADLLKTQYDSRIKSVNDHFDDRILHRAQTLANLAQSQWQLKQREELPELHALSLVTAGSPGQDSYLPTLAWLFTSRVINPEDSRRLYFPGTLKILFADEVLSQNRMGGDQEYFQLYKVTGETMQRSESLKDKGSTFTLDPWVRDHLPPLESKFDDTTLSPGGISVRRVTLKTPVFHMLSGRRAPRPRTGVGATVSSRANASKRRDEPPPDRPPRPPRVITLPSAFIQCAYETGPRDAEIASIQAQRQNDVDRINAESSEKLARLRRDLFWICLGALGACLLGGFLVVGLGLSPLQRLSDAVTHVSEKNFRLPLEEATVPVELRPILNGLQNSLELLGRAFAREKQAAADISHELRTPVAALLTSIEVALRRQRSPEEYREVLHECRAVAQQIGHLVERLLALARLDAGADHLRPTKVNATALAEQCAALVRPLADARGLRLSVHTSQPVTITADPDKLREVVTNLLHNAIQYNRPDGAIDLSVGRENGTLCMEVRDTGVGIAPDAREHIFERFFRADAARQSDGVHAGLGLAIVKGYVELMGGTISVESTDGKGSTFAVHIPLDREKRDH